MVLVPTVQIASFSMADSLIIMVIALVVFGPRRLPQIGRQMGKLMYEFRKASNDFKFQMEEELRSAEDAERRKKEEAERQRNLALAVPPQATGTIEAQADIGAVETPVASPYQGETHYPSAYPPETPSAETMPVVGLPRIQPPLTGEQVSTGAPSSVQPAETSEPLLNGSEVHNPTATPPTEPVSQHG
jgi:sec-independent protein translocase protein TatB